MAFCDNEISKREKELLVLREMRNTLSRMRSSWDAPQPTLADTRYR